MSRVAELGCIVSVGGIRCEAPCELHHVTIRKGMGLRASHKDILGLCPKHHRTGGFGVAVHAGVRTWEANWGTQEDLLALTREMLGG